ncbi:hypothetical protein CN305_13655 [Bacillus cereus]|uniref:YopX family protein n=1 Tax=Bacillus cereus TaxID=1396 RepID=UPI000BF55204|nr:YopX family protein [Bacillus cereus]PFD19252.1 hypothetical protein CN305_13655 [Bacillus cereus]
MREIKFRAWDKEFKQFSDMALNYKIADINFYTDYEWMQYTGLKDKNGKEIYEGDVILVIEWNRKYNVVFERGMFKASGSTTFSLVTATNGELSCQVIGNIYENPELLKN